MAYTLDNKCTKNCCKRTILVQLIIEDVVTIFWNTLDTDFTVQSRNEAHRNSAEIRIHG